MPVNNLTTTRLNTMVKRNVNAKAERQTVETPKAPGSASDFTGLPKRKEDIAVNTPGSEMSEHMRVIFSFSSAVSCMIYRIKTDDVQS